MISLDLTKLLASKKVGNMNIQINCNNGVARVIMNKHVNDQSAKNKPISSASEEYTFEGTEKEIVNEVKALLGVETLIQ